MAGFENTTAAQEKREQEAREGEKRAKKSANARTQAEDAIASELAGGTPDWELVARLTLGDVMAHGEDKDRVNAARAFLAPKKAKEEPPAGGSAPAWLSDPEAAKPVAGGGEAT